MEKFWIYLFSHLFCIACGTVLGMLIDKDVVYRGKFLFKQRGRDNRQEPRINVEMKARHTREERKQARIVRRNAKKEAKAAEKLEKTL